MHNGWMLKRLDNFLVPMQCMDNSGCFPQGKWAAIVWHYPAFFFFFFFLCVMFSCFHTTGCEAYSFVTDVYGIFNMHTHLGECLKGGQAQTSLHKSWLGGTEKLSLTLSQPGDLKPGSSDLNVDALTSELRSPSSLTETQTHTHTHVASHPHYFN